MQVRKYSEQQSKGSNNIVDSHTYAYMYIYIYISRYSNDVIVNIVMTS